ncbi:MAG TPA: hypothetical protein VIC57_15075 [Candidatus Dormibacteraeota bacterium]|jgi:hypothetical protein
MTYELWDEASGNRIEGFQEFAKLAEVVRQIAELQGARAVDDLFVEVWADLEALDPVRVMRADELRRLIPPVVRTYALEPGLRPGGHARATTTQPTLVFAARL